MRSRILALLLVLAIWPAMSELVEVAVHFAQHGDLAHAEADGHAGTPLGADEHGCSPLFHLCASGHANVTSCPRVAVAIAVPASRAAPPIAPPLDQAGCDPASPPIRPPIA